MQARVLAAVVAILLLLAGCAGGGGTRVEDGGIGVAPQPGAPEPDAPTQEDADAPTVERKIARSGQLTLSVDDPAAAARRLRETATAFGGFVTSEYVVLPTAGEGEVPGSRSQVTSQVSLSVPADRFGETMDAAATVGTELSRSVSSADVTSQVVDVEARIRTMRESIARLEELMTRAGSLEEITVLEAELTRRQADLESLVAQQEALGDLVERSSITVTLLTSAQARVEARGGFLAGLAAGWAAFVLVLRVLVTAVGAALPFLVAAALVTLPALWWWRRRRVRRGEAPAATPSAPAQAPATDVTAPAEQRVEDDI